MPKLSSATSIKPHKAKIMVQCEYCGCYIDSKQIHHYAVDTYTKPTRHTAAGTQFYTNGREHTRHLVDLCADCHNTASTSMFREITGAKTGLVQYTYLDKGSSRTKKKAVNS